AAAGAAATTSQRASVLTLIERDCRVDRPRPGIHAPDEIVNVAVARLFQEQPDLHAAPAVVADRDDGLRLIDLLQPARHLAHRHELRAVDARALEFPRLA